jgi:hypothetical protein
MQIDPASAPIASDIRRGASWFALPLAAASLIRLALEPQYWSIPYLAWLVAIPIYVILQQWILRRPGPGRIRLALLVNFLAIGVGYTMISAAMNAAHGWRADDALYRIEQTIFGCDPQQFLAPFQRPWLSTISILGYVSFVFILIYLFLAEAFRLTRQTGRLQLGLMSLYGIGYSNYILLPAAGPIFHHPALLPSINHSSISGYLDPWVISCCSGADAWPSLHAGVCCVTLIWTFSRHRSIFYLLILPSAALLLGAVYFQFHYFIDLLAGGILGAACIQATAGSLQSAPRDLALSSPTEGV